MGSRFTSALGSPRSAGSGEILVSSTVREAVIGSDMQFTDRGTHSLKGVPDQWHLFALSD